MQIRFLHDPDTEEPHIYNHGVTELEVIEVLSSSPLTLHAGEGAFMALGQTASGRYLKVVYRDDPEDDDIFVITAIPLQGKALKAFRRRRRRRGK